MRYYWVNYAEFLLFILLVPFFGVVVDIKRIKMHFLVG